MSERDCGKWYCQDAAGFSWLELGVDVKIAPVVRADADDRRDLDRERAEIKAWMEGEREAGFTGWLAAYSHGNGAAQHYWVWDPDSTGKYMEIPHDGPWKAGHIRADFGELHRGRGWQLPLLAVMTEAPTSGDRYELEEVRVPYVVLGEDPPGGEDEEPPECELSIPDGAKQSVKINAKLDYIICLLEG